MIPKSHQNFVHGEQIVLQTTRTGNILDLRFINNMDAINYVKVSKTLLAAHNMAEFTMYGPKETVDIRPTRISQDLSSLSFHKANYKQREKDILKKKLT